MADFTDRLLCAIGAHAWGKWSQYTWHGVRYTTFGDHDPLEVTVRRQKRTCQVCDKMQDERVY